MRLELLAVVALAGCHKDARAIPPAPPARPAAAPVANAPELVQVPPDVVSQIALREIAHGLPRPVLLTHAPNDRRLFVVEQRGAIAILGKDQPFFTIGGLSTGNEEGLLGGVALWRNEPQA